MQNRAFNFRKLETRTQRQTTMITAHRLSAIVMRTLSSFSKMDALLKKGTHEELMALGDWYAKTYDRQQLEATLRKGRRS